MCLSASFAQTTITSPFTTVSVASLNLGTDGQSQVSKLSTAYHKGNFRYALMAAFDDWANSSAGNVSFSIPGETTTYQSRAMEIIYRNAQSYTYIGKIDGAANGNFAFTRDSDGITGFIQLSTEFYSFYPLGGNKVVMLQDTSLSGLNCGVDEVTSSVLASFCSPEENECSALIDIQVLKHPSAVSTIPVGFTTMATLQFNTVLLNSQIYNKKVRLRTFLLPFSFGLSSDIISDVTNLQASSQAQSFKKNDGADITVLLTNNSYTINGFPIFGIAFTGVSSGDKAFAIVEAPFAIGGRFTFAHECAHIFGALHNRGANGGDDDAADCAHALRYIGASGVARFTVLARLGTGSRIPYFSNPSVSFDGFPTGLSGNDMVSANNAKKIRNASCTADDFEQPGNMYVQIAGKRTLCTPETQTYQALITAGKNYGKAPFTVVWTYSTTPNGAQTSLPNTPVTNMVSVSTAFSSPGGSIYLKVVVTGGDGYIYTETRQIFIQPGYCGFQGSDDRNADSDRIQYDSPIALYPNPASSEIYLSSLQPGRKLCQVEIYNAYGQRTLATDYNAIGSDNLQIDLATLAPAIYFVRCRTTDGIFTKSFTLQP